MIKSGGIVNRNGSQCKCPQRERKFIPDEAEPAIISTMIDAKWTAISYFVEENRSLRSRYDEDIRYLAKEHKLGIGKHFSERMILVLAESLHNAQRDRKSDHFEFNVFGSNNIKDLFIVSGLWWSREHISISPAFLQSLCPATRLLFPKTKKLAGTWEHSGKVSSKSEKGKSVDLRQRFRSRTLRCTTFAPFKIISKHPPKIEGLTCLWDISALSFGGRECQREIFSLMRTPEATGG